MLEYRVSIECSPEDLNLHQNIASSQIPVDPGRPLKGLRGEGVKEIDDKTVRTPVKQSENRRLRNIILSFDLFY